MAKSYLSTADAARELGISRHRVHSLIATKRLKAMRWGARYQIKPADLDAMRNRPPQPRARKPRPPKPARKMIEVTDRTTRKARQVPLDDERANQLVAYAAEGACIRIKDAWSMLKAGLWITTEAYVYRLALETV